MSAIELVREVEPLLARIEAVGAITSVAVDAPSRGVGIHFADRFDAKRVARVLGGMSSTHYDSDTGDGFTTYEGAVWVVEGSDSEPVNLCLYGPHDSDRARHLAETAVQA